MITTYAQLKTAINSWLNISTSALSGQIDDLITVGEKRLFRQARTRQMEAALSGTISSGVMALPDGYVALKSAYLTGNPVRNIKRKSVEWIYDNYPNRGGQSKPSYIAREGDHFIFGPSPDSGYTVQGIYYQRLDSIASTVTDFFLENADLYLFACLAESDLLLGRDSRIPIWEAKYTNILGLVNKEDHEEAAMTSMEVTPG